MLGFRKAKPDAVSGFLGTQTEFAGKLSFSGVVHLDGNFTGEIISRGTLVVGSESVVHAEIHSSILKIAGEVHGDLIATEKIELYPPAKIYGNIRTPSLVVEEGVIFEGTCRMSSVSAEIPALVDPRHEATDEEPLEEISAQAWPPTYEVSDKVDESVPDKALPKHE
ncbi:MAG: polymer-forming cytoskeletal protein [Desulfomonile tiedjei]|nr:polymer-forming cytoskeletal protein [Desulfomonile tiedjei]